MPAERNDVGMKEMLSPAAEAAGWIGALCTAVAYGLVSRRRIEPDSTVFQSLNLSGAALLAVSAAFNGTWPVVAANFVWILIGVQALAGARPALGAVADRVGSALRSRLRRAGKDRGEARRALTASALNPVAGSETPTAASHRS